MWSVRTVIQWLLVICLCKTVVSEKVFKSIPVTVKAYENDTVLLPCYADDVGTNLRVKWYKDTTLLGDSHTPYQVLPPRLRLHSNFSLEIEALEASDTADYTCEIIRPEPWGPIRQTHSIEVQYAPTVKTIPEDGFQEVRKGEYVDIGCEVTGTPDPIVNWRKNGEAMALLEHRSRIRFKAEHRLLAGVYECVVNNGVGEPVKAAITVAIDDAPVVSAVRGAVHTAIGLRAVLAARLDFSSPPPRTAWYRDGRPIKTDDRVIMMVQDNIHQLIFRSVRKSDVGDYTFRAENHLGMADVAFKLTAVPNVPWFKVDPALNRATATSYNLLWEVDSYDTIIEYNLWLRPYYGHPTPEPESFTETPNHYSKIVVPGDATDGPIHSASYTVRGLTPSTVYEAIVTARNRFGWSKPSAVLHFATASGVGPSGGAEYDYADINPVLEEEPETHNISQASVLKHYNAITSSSTRHKTPAILSMVLAGVVIQFISSRGLFC